jgi:hypothetical protein
MKQFVKFICKCLNDDGKFLTDDTSLSPSENGEEFAVKKFHLLKRFKSLIGVIYYLFFGKGVQFGGLKRDISEIIGLFEKNSLFCTHKFSSAKQSFLIFEAHAN